MDNIGSQSNSGNSDFDINFSRLALQSETSAFGPLSVQPNLTRSNSIPLNLQHHFLNHQINQAVNHQIYHQPSQEHISDRISKIIQQNQSIVGKITESHQNNSKRNTLKEKDSYRKRPIRGPWRYEERILQLGYQPQPSRNPVNIRRRNSLPVQTLSQRDIIRPYQSAISKSAFKRRASLPVICGALGMCDSPNRLLPATQSQGLSRSASDVNNGNQMVIHIPVIQVNPTHRSTSSRALIEEEPVEETSRGNVSDSPESDSSELIIVDDTEESAFRNQILDENKDSVLHCVPFVPKEDTNMEDEEVDGIMSDGSSNLGYSLTPGSSSGVRQSSVIKPIPSQPMIRKISMDDLHEFGENKKLKADEIVSPILANVPPNVLSAIEEVQRKAAATVTQPGRNNSINQNNLKGSSTNIRVSHHVDGETPNAVLHNPLSSPVSKNGYQNDREGVDINSDEEDTRPYKCFECQKGFRISGHLARHKKSELHLKRMQELRDLGLEGSIRPIAVPRMPQTESLTVSPDFGSSSPGMAMFGYSHDGVNYDDGGINIEDGDDGPSGRRFRCNICNTAFRFQGHLDRHMRSTMHQSMLEAVETDFIPTSVSFSTFQN